MTHRKPPEHTPTPQEIMQAEHEMHARTVHLPTGTQTVGPFFHEALLPEGDIALIRGDDLPPGRRIRIEGRLLDGAGAPVNDAMLELWQPDGTGHFHTDAARADFDGFGRIATREDGSFSVATLKPGGQGEEAPHIAVHLMARGLLHTLATRLYFEDEDNDTDPVLAGVPAERRATLLARCEADGVYRFDIHLQGARETVFFEH
ncbi:protocatechuate 3,4-dioxygenase subunit alpha [Kushneria sp. AK178]